MNFKPFLDSTQIALEKQASDKFGAAVEDFTRGTLGALSQRVPPPGEQVPFNRGDGSFYSTSYAHALAGGTSFRPKLKFLFKVEFVFTPNAAAQFPKELRDRGSQDFTFMVRSVDRPKIDFEYEKDVNMYNFRTSVLKRINHRELTITFMDDTGNRVLDFFRVLMMLNSPITRRQIFRDGTLNPPTPIPTLTNGNGMAFESIQESNKDTAIRGVVNTDVGNAISAIRVKQIYVEPGVPLGSAVKEVIFDFMNARLVSFDLDELSHESSDPNLMTMQFDYDWMEIVKVGALSMPDTPVYNIQVPGVGGAPVDISPYGATGPQPSPGNGNGFFGIIANQLGRAGQQFTSEAVNRGVATIAGRGRFASLISSQASNALGGLVGAASRDLASGIGRVSMGQITGALGGSRATVTDSAAGGPSPVIGVTESRKPEVSIQDRSNEAAEERGHLVTSPTGHVTWEPEE